MDKPTFTADEDAADIVVTGHTLVKALNALDQQLTTKIELKDKILTQFEQQLAILVSGYAELTAIVESMFSMFINKHEDDREEFFKALGTARKTMMETLQHGIKTAETNADRFVAHSTGADEQPVSDTPSGD